MTPLVRRLLLICVFALPLLLVVFAVVMGTAMLLTTMGDQNGALALRWVGTAIEILFAVAAIGLLFILGLLKLQEFEDE